MSVPHKTKGDVISLCTVVYEHFWINNYVDLGLAIVHCITFSKGNTPSLIFCNMSITTELFFLFYAGFVGTQSLPTIRLFLHPGSTAKLK